MKVFSYSDLHFEENRIYDFHVPPHSEDDLFVFAGDNFSVNSDLRSFFARIKANVVVVLGNHEYYRRSFDELDSYYSTIVAFKSKFEELNNPKVHLLLDESISINGINVFGGTMWTELRLPLPRYTINDFSRITCGGNFISYDDVRLHHYNFCSNLSSFFSRVDSRNSIVATHHAPCVAKETKYTESPLLPFFNSLDMVDCIFSQRPLLWIYGHTHESDDQFIGDTRMISNPRGYYFGNGKFENGKFENGKFDPLGKVVGV